jgi:hypothetical protein
VLRPPPPGQEQQVRGRGKPGVDHTQDGEGDLCAWVRLGGGIACAQRGVGIVRPADAKCRSWLHGGGEAGGVAAELAHAAGGGDGEHRVREVHGYGEDQGDQVEQAQVVAGDPAVAGGEERVSMLASRPCTTSA